MVEGARLESVYTLIAYRGFESLSLRQTKKIARASGLFFGLAEREALVRTLWFDKMRQHFGPPQAPPQGVKTRDAIAF